MGRAARPSSTAVLQRKWHFWIKEPITLFLEKTIYYPLQLYFFLTCSYLSLIFLRFPHLLTYFDRFLWILLCKCDYYCTDNTFFLLFFWRSFSRHWVCHKELQSLLSGRIRSCTNAGEKLMCPTGEDVLSTHWSSTWSDNHERWKVGWQKCQRFCF